MVVGRRREGWASPWVQAEDPVDQSQPDALLTPTDRTANGPMGTAPPQARTADVLQREPFDAIGVHGIDEPVRVLGARCGHRIKVVDESSGHGLG